MNVLFIILDDANRLVLSQPGLTLPNFRRLRDRGTTFTSAFCQAPLCGPSRASLLTGQHPNTTGILDHDQIPFRTHLPDVVTLPQYFRQNGYTTAGNGKIFHPTAGDPDWIDIVSWDRYDLPGPSGHPLPDPAPKNGYNTTWDWGAINGMYIDDQVTDASISFLQEPHTANFFLGIGLVAAHIPWYVPWQFMNQVNQVVLPQVADGDLDDIPQIARNLAEATGMPHRWVVDNGKWTGAVKSYLASLLHLDHNLGRLLDALDASPYAGNTITVVCSDHGMHLGEKGHWSKFSLWCEAVQVPLIISVPGQLCRVYGNPVANMDIFPTLVELCGLPAAPDLEGASLVSVLNGGECQNREVTSVYEGHVARISEAWWRIDYTDGSQELYNNARDPSQWFNLAGIPAYLPWVE